MTEIIVDEDCGNSPKKALLRDFNVAFAEEDVEFILETVSEDVEWITVGDREIHGKGGLEAALEEMTGGDIVTMTIDHVITHGATGAVDGALLLADGTEYAFCDVYEFGSHGKNAKIQSITSYVIESAGDE